MHDPNTRSPQGAATLASDLIRGLVTHRDELDNDDWQLISQLLAAGALPDCHAPCCSNTADLH